MTARTSIAIAAILLGSAAATPAQAADLWRMYRCTGDQGEAVFTDRKLGTDCREIWLSPRGKSGWLVTDPAVKTAEQDAQQ